MDNPIGLHVGNALEVAESIHCLQGNGPDDLMELVCKLGGHLLFTAGRVNSFEEGNTKLQEVIDNGAALKKFKDMITSQGVKEDVANKLCADDPWCVLRRSKYVTDIKSSKT
ncbi:thymidine phosphorylase-like, partial [Saccoglossus kowalevskii]